MLVTLDTYARVMEMLWQYPELIVDSETTGLKMWQGDKLIGIAIEAEKQQFYFPFRHIEGNLPIEKLDDFRPLLSSPKKTYVGYNYTFDMQTFLQDGIPIPPKIQEVKTMAHLLNENEPSFALKELGNKYLTKGASQERDELALLMLQRGLGKGDMGKLPAHLVAPYACKDVELTRQLRDFYIPHLEKWEILNLWHEYNEYEEVLTHVQANGLPIDIEMCQDYRTEARAEADKIVELIRGMAGFPINLNSAKQICTWLGVKSSAQEFLQDLKELPKGCAELFDYRAWHRVDANYYSKFITQARNSILHSNLNTIGTVTGRLAAKDPPMQAIPTESGGKMWKVKDVFVAPEGEEIWEADYSLAELRVGSHYAGERKMADRIEAGEDLHQLTADDIGCGRPIAKNINFSVFYGIGARTLNQKYLHKTEKEAKALLDKYHATYPGIRKLYYKAEKLAEQRGYIRMWSGRMRHFNTLMSPTHKASSALVQGSVGEMLRKALVEIRRQTGVVTKLPVHDSLLFSLPKARAPELAKEINRIMLEAGSWCSVKMRVDFKRGPSWGLAKKVEL